MKHGVHYDTVLKVRHLVPLGFRFIFSLGVVFNIADHCLCPQLKGVEQHFVLAEVVQVLLGSTHVIEQSLQS